MKNSLQIGFLLCIVSFISSCQTSNTKEKIIQDKNNCFNGKLYNLKNFKLYLEVMAAFKDTFQVLKTKKENFGAPEVVSNQIDEGIFFKKDSSECMLIVLIKTKYSDLSFGNARMIRGVIKKSKWNFEVSMDYFFAKDYFKLYSENSFENISKLARYCVLTEGNYRKKGCEIDDYFWFIELNK